MRRRKVKERIILPDPRFNEVVVTKFVNNLMLKGKKNTAFKIFYDAVDIIEEKTSESGLESWRSALKNVTPAVEVRSRRVGGATYQVPMEVRAERRVSLALRWIKKYARDRKDKTMAERLSAELIAASNGEGSAVKKKDEVHRMAEANKAFAHFKW